MVTARTYAKNVRHRVAVVGAGLAGLLIAGLFARRGWDVTVFEKRSASNEWRKGRSINLALSHRGIVALRRLGIEPALKPLVVPMRGRMIHMHNRLDFQAYDPVRARYIFSIARSELQHILYCATAAACKIRFNVACVGADVSAGTLTLRDHRGEEEASFDAIIGADGIDSVVRHSILGLEDPSPRVHPHGYKELTIPAPEASRAALDRAALHIWPRHKFMLIALPNRDGSFTATLFLPSSGKNSFGSLRKAQDVERFFERYFRDARSLFPTLINDFFVNPVGRLSTVQPKRWINGKATIIGDAAHTMLPFYGQGMNCALEDCIELDDAFEAEATFESAFARFYRTRRLDAAAISKLSFDNYREMRDTVLSPEFSDDRALEIILQQRNPDHYLPLYSMIAFTSIPYGQVMARARAQRAIVRKWREASPIVTDDLSGLDTMIRRSLSPLPPDRMK